MAIPFRASQEDRISQATSFILLHNDPSPVFVAGRTLTGGTSGATGVVAASPAPSSSSTTITTMVGVFAKNETVTESTSSNTATLNNGSTDNNVTTSASVATGLVYSTITEITTTAIYTVGERITQGGADGGQGTVIASNGSKTLIEVYFAAMLAAGSTLFVGATSSVSGTATAFSTTATNVIVS